MSDQNSVSAAGPTVPEISVDELVTHVANNDVFLIDLRHAVHGKQIYGAIRYDSKKLLDAPKLALPLPKTDGLIVLYDDKGESKVIADVAARFAAEGFAETRKLAGGFAAYEAAGGKLEEPTMEQPVPLVSEHQIKR
jgi:rhodanese-related sulfurtransferase